MRNSSLTRIAAVLPLCGLATAQMPQPLPAHEPEPMSSFWWEDFDGDGQPDAFVVAPDGEARLLQNRGGGNLEDVTAAAGLRESAAVRFAAWEDFDADGRPDLFLGTLAGPSLLFRNQGSGTFVEMGAIAGLKHAGEDLHAAWLDYDMDGLADLHVRTRSESLLYRNLGEGLFEAVDLGLEPSTVPAPAPSAPSREASSEAPPSSVGAGPRPQPEKAPTGSGTRKLASAPSEGPTVVEEGGVIEVGPSISEAIAIPLCAKSIEDQAVPGACLRASSVPKLGRLYPISNDLFVEAGTGFVGLGTTTPGVRLEVDGQQLNHGSHSGAMFKADNQIDGPTRGYLGVQGTVNFDGIASADWFSDEIGVAGISVGGGQGDNRGVLGHSSGAGVRGEHSGNPAQDYGELGRNGIGLRASGSNLAAELLGDVDVSGADSQLTVLDGDGDPAAVIGGSPTGTANRFDLYRDGVLAWSNFYAAAGLRTKWFNTANGISVLEGGVSPNDSHAFWYLNSSNGTQIVKLDADGDDSKNGISQGLLRIRSAGTGGTGGQLEIQNNDGETRMLATGGGGSSTGPRLLLMNGDGVEAVRLGTEAFSNSAGIIEVTNGMDAKAKVILDGDGSGLDGGAIFVRASDGGNTIIVRGEGAGGGGDILLKNGADKITISMKADTGGGGTIRLLGADGFRSVKIDGEGLNGGGDLALRNSGSVDTVLLLGDSGPNPSDGGCLQLLENDGSLAADFCQTQYHFSNNAGAATIVFDRNTGAKSAAIDTPSYGRRLYYALETPEVWLEDFGGGRLQNGEARIELDPIFLESVTVNEEHPLRVFVTLTGNCRGVFVEKDATGFFVRELEGGASATPFDYRVAAKRRGLESTRLELFEALSDDHDHSRRPERVSEVPDEEPARTSESAGETDG